MDAELALLSLFVIAEESGDNPAVARRASQMLARYVGKATASLESIGAVTSSDFTAHQQRQPPARKRLEEKAGPHEYATTHFRMPDEIATHCRNLSSFIADEHLASDGRESDYHVTLLYGFHEDVSAADVQHVLTGIGPVTVRLGGVSHFSNDEQDVVKLDVASADLHAMHDLLAEALPNTQSHRRYNPHLTLGYVQPGMGRYYDGLSGLEGREIVLSTLIFADRHGVELPIVLDGLMEGCVTNKTGTGHHDSETGHPCKVDGNAEPSRQAGADEGSLEQGESELRRWVNSGGGTIRDVKLENLQKGTLPAGVAPLYRQTQERFADAGIHERDLVRGVSLKKPDLLAILRSAEGDLSDAAAWSQDESASREFVTLNNGVGKLPVIFSVPDTPVSHIIVSHDTSRIFSDEADEEGFTFSEEENIAAIGKVALQKILVDGDEIDLDEVIDDINSRRIDDRNEITLVFSRKQDLGEGCVVNRSGKGHHDTETGHPCKVDGDKTSASSGKSAADSSKASRKPKAVRVEMHGARREGEGKNARVVLADGSPAPEQGLRT